VTENKLELIANPGETTFVTRRTVNAPRTLVFEAFTRPEHIKRWMGAPSCLMVSCESDFRVGGSYRFVHGTPDGQTFACRGVYRKIAAPARIVRTFIFEPVPDHEAIETVVFEEHEGKTTITTTTDHDSVASRDGHLAGDNMFKGMTEGYAVLDGLLAELTRGNAAA
jgi:uncharacterized protein YndB with AHSA1/START domain